MSNSYVRNIIEAYINANFATPFYETVNFDSSPDVDEWCAIDWGFSYPRKLTYCDEFAFDGTFQVIFFGRVGIGDDTLLASSETDIATLNTFLDATGQLEIESITMPEDFRQDVWYGISYSVDYLYKS